jgi:hypothetical protein
MAPVASKTKNEPATGTETPLRAAQTRQSEAEANVRQWEQRVAEADEAVTKAEQDAAGSVLDSADETEALETRARDLAERRAAADVARGTRRNTKAG